MANRAELHDQLVSFVQNEHRGGFLLADPLTICTIDFWEHFGPSSRHRTVSAAISLKPGSPI
jgi:hypothetical protein